MSGHQNRIKRFITNHFICSRISDAIENHVDKARMKLVRVEVRTDAAKDGAYTQFQINFKDLSPMPFRAQLLICIFFIKKKFSLISMPNFVRVFVFVHSCHSIRLTCALKLSFKHLLQNKLCHSLVHVHVLVSPHLQLPLFMFCVSSLLSSMPSNSTSSQQFV